MKKLLLLACALLLVAPAFSQSYEWTERRGEQIHDLTLLSDGSVFLASDDSHGGSGFFVHKPDGTLLEDPFNLTWAEHYELTETADGGYFLGLNGIECDVFISGVVKFDNNWAYQWDWVNFNGGRSQVAPFSNGDVLHTEGTKLFRRNAVGDFVWDLELGQPINDLATGPGDFVYVALDNGIFKLDGDGTDLDIMTGEYVQQMITGPEGKVAAARGGLIYLYDADLVLSASQNLGIFELIIDFDFDGEHLAVLLMDDTSIYPEEVKIFDADLTEINSFNLPNQIDFRKISLRGDEVLLAGRELYGQDETASVVKAFAFDGTTVDYGMDAALASALIGEVGIKYLDFGVDALVLGAVQVTLENAGDSTLHEVTIAVRGPEMNFGFCFWDQFFTQTFTGLDLPPGGVVTLPLDTIEVIFYDGFPPPDEFCFFAYLPNHRTDQQHANNFACDGFVVAAKEVPAAIAQLDIYPNPTAGQLTVQLPAALPADAEMTLRNSYGQVVLRSVFAKNETAKSLNVSGLVGGIYFLEIVEMSSGKVWASRVVVAD